MDFRVVLRGERNALAEHHPALVADRPDLLEPALGENPEQGGDDFPYLFYSLEGGRVAGHLMAFPDTLFVAGKPLPWAWNLGLFTESEYRRRGIARQLVKLQIQEFGRRGIIRGSTFSAPTTLHIFSKLGFSMPGYATRLCLIRNVRPFLRAHVTNRIALAAGSAAANTLLASHRRLRHLSEQNAQVIVTVVEGERFATLVDNSLIRTERYFWGRDSRWFLARCSPIDSFHEIRRPGDTEPCAVMIVRDRLVRERQLSDKYSNFRMLSVMEFCALDGGDDVPELIVAATLEIFSRSNADIAEIVTSETAIQRSAYRQGFRALGTGMSFSFIAPAGNIMHDTQTRLEEWHLSHFCGDGYGFE